MPADELKKSDLILKEFEDLKKLCSQDKEAISNLEEKLKVIFKSCVWVRAKYCKVRIQYNVRIGPYIELLSQKKMGVLVSYALK